MPECETPDAKAKRTVLAIEIPRDELAFRIMREAAQIKPPPGMTAAEAMADVERSMPHMAEIFRRQADAAVIFFHECVDAARQPS